MAISDLDIPVRDPLSVTPNLLGPDVIKITSKVKEVTPVLNNVTDVLLPGKVDKVANQGLSDTNYTQVEKSKLGTVAANATANSSDAFLLSRANHLGSVLNNAVFSPFGDSITAYANNTGNPYYNSDGFITWLNILTGGRLDMISGANQGIPGNTTTQMIARLGAALAFKPAVSCILAGTNSIAISGQTSAQIIADLKIIHDGYRAIGTRFPIITILPRFGTGALTAGQETTRQAVNAWILTQGSATTPIVNAESVMNNSALFQTDGIHPNSQGSYRLASLVAPYILPWLDTAIVTKQVLQDVALTTNVNFTGTTGGKNGTATGTVPTSWTLLQTNMGGGAVAGSITNDNGVNQFVFTLSGTYTGSNKYAGLLSNFATTALVGGDVTESFIDFEILTALVGVVGIAVSTTYNGSGGYLSDSYNFFPNDTLPSLLPIGRYQMRGFPFVAPVGVISVDTNVVIHLAGNASGAAVSGSIKIHKVGSLVTAKRSFVVIEQIPTALKASVVAGTYPTTGTTTGEFSGTQPAGSVLGMKFKQGQARYEFMYNDSNVPTWVRSPVG